MKRRHAMALMGLACAGVLAGCAQYYYGPSAAAPVAQDLLALSRDAADALLAQVVLDPAQPVIVSTVVQLDRLDASSRLGRLVSEQVGGRFVQRGLRVTELRMRDSLALRPGQGELLLSRQVLEVARAQAAQAVLVGTYATAPQAVFVSLKLVGMGNAVLAAHDYVLPMDGNVRGLLAAGL
ncbi:FlgO family outer membrane protein [Alicycliphilus denitrificans]|uniref:FlgO family outer membrane protein n=1 Tax=Alicycliphilus denitrificans TaxID=179636 RepID=UPI00385014EC